MGMLDGKKMMFLAKRVLETLGVAPIPASHLLPSKLA